MLSPSAAFPAPASRCWRARSRPCSRRRRARWCCARDVERKALFGNAESEKLPADAYAPDVTARVYATHRRQGAPHRRGRPFGDRRRGVCRAAGAAGRWNGPRDPRRAAATACFSPPISPPASPASGAAAATPPMPTPPSRAQQESYDLGALDWARQSGRDRGGAGRMAGRRRASILAANRFTSSRKRQESSTRPLPTREAMQIDDPPTRPGFITALDDAYLMPREDGYAVFWRTSGRDLCTVAGGGRRARAAPPGQGRAAGHLVGHAARTRRRLDAVVGARGPVGRDERRGRRRGDPAPHRALAGRARAGAGARPALGAAAAGRRAPGQRAGRRAAAAPRARPRLLGGLRALFRAQLARARAAAHMIAVIAGGDEDRGTDVREQMTRSAALLFGERGFSGTGLRDVIAHSSTPRGSIYHHFAGGKAELAREAVRHAAGAVAGPRGRRGARRRPDRDAARLARPLARRAGAQRLPRGQRRARGRGRARGADGRARRGRGRLRGLGRRLRRHAAGRRRQAQEGGAARHARP